MYYYYIRYTSVIASDFLSQHPRPNHGLWEEKRVSTWWRGPARLTEKVGCTKDSYFLEFMYVDVARDFVGVVFHVLLDGAKFSHKHGDCCYFEPPHSLNFDFQVFVFVGVGRYSHVDEKAGFILLVL